MPIYDYNIKFKFRLMEGQKEKIGTQKIRSNIALKDEELKSKIKDTYKFPGMAKFSPFTLRIVKKVNTYYHNA